MNASKLIFWLIPAIAVAFIAVVLNMVRRRHLLETHALLWIFTFLVVAVSPAFVPFLDHIAYRVGIAYPPTLYLLVAIFILMANTLRNTIAVSKLSDQNRRLAQELALLRNEMKSKTPPGPPDA